MTYTVKELFLTVEGESVNIGRVAVFIRFAGCDLWSGREEDRARDLTVLRYRLRRRHPVHRAGSLG